MSDSLQPHGYTVHGILQARTLEWVAISFSTYQATNSIFQRTRTNNFTICMEIQKTSNSQSSLEKQEWRNQPARLQTILQSYSHQDSLEKQEWRNQPARLQTILQSYSHQDSMVVAQRQKYRSMEQHRKSRDKSTHLWTPYV